MATVCGCCLAMLDAGVPLKSSVAGVAMGLILGVFKIVYVSACAYSDDQNDNDSGNYGYNYRNNNNDDGDVEKVRKKGTSQ